MLRLRRALRRLIRLLELTPRQSNHRPKHWAKTDYRFVR